MPKIDLTNRELQYLKDIMLFNDIDENSYYAKIVKPLEPYSSKAQLIREVDLNLTNKINNTEEEGFKG